MLANHIGELLEIVYMDQSGKLTQRRIEIKHIRNGLIYADCLRSGEPRTFKEENILAWQPSKAIRPTISVKEWAVMQASQSSPSTVTASSGSARSNTAINHSQTQTKFTNTTYSSSKRQHAERMSSTTSFQSSARSYPVSKKPLNSGKSKSAPIASQVSHVS